MGRMQEIAFDAAAANRSLDLASPQRALVGAQLDHIPETMGSGFMRGEVRALRRTRVAGEVGAGDRPRDSPTDPEFPKRLTVFHESADNRCNERPPGSIHGLGKRRS